MIPEAKYYPAQQRWICRDFNAQRGFEGLTKEQAEYEYWVAKKLGELSK